MQKLLIAVCVTGCILMGSALGKITYIDVTPSNATLNGAALIAGTTYSTNYTDVTDNLWGWRTNRTDVNGNTIWETDGGAFVGDAESTAPLKIDITLPDAGVLYDLYAVIMNNNSGAGQWDVSARIGDSGAFKDFNKNSSDMTQALASDFEGTVVVSGGGDRTMKVRIGYYVTAAANETVSIYINGVDTWKNAVSYDQRTRFDGVGYKASNAIYVLSPSNGQTDVAVTDVSLSWAGGLDPNAVGHYVYLGTEPGALTCLNPASPVSVNTGTYSIGNIETDTTYYWQIEMALDHYPAGDPNNVFGPVWSFSTIPSVPIITMNPGNQVADAGGTAEFTVGVDSLTTPTFKWYSSVDPVNNTPADDIYLANTEVLSLTGLTVSDECYYYCVVGNSGNIVVVSDVAGLAVKRVVAHWSMNTADYVNGQYLDLSGEGHHADPNGTPAFVSGKLAEGISVLRPDDTAGPTTDSWARAGTWNPSKYSGALSVSFWLNWSGTNMTNTEQAFISKRSGANLADATQWQIIKPGASGTPTMWFQSPTNTVSADALTPRQWQLITITFDGTTARIYSNGVLMGSGSFRLGNAVDAMINLGGHSFDTIPARWMNGILDDVKIFNYGLSDVEVAQIYVSDNPGNSVCVNSLKPAAAYDLNGDCIVNLGDFAVLAGAWLDCGLVPDCIQ
jgi:hypothetical protein